MRLNEVFDVDEDDKILRISINVDQSVFIGNLRKFLIEEVVEVGVLINLKGFRVQTKLESLNEFENCEEIQFARNFPRISKEFSHKTDEE
jgi:hypothetical protein